MAKKKKTRDGLWGLVFDKAEEAADILSDGKLIDTSVKESNTDSRRDKRDSGRRDRDSGGSRDAEIEELRDAVKELSTLIARLDASSRKSDGPEGPAAEPAE